MGEAVEFLWSLAGRVEAASNVLVAAATSTRSKVPTPKLGAHDGAPVFDIFSSRYRTSSSRGAPIIDSVVLYTNDTQTLTAV